MIKTFSICLLVFTCNNLFSQVVINGIVKSKNEILTDVNVTVSKKGNNQIIAFSITDEKGFFEIKNSLTEDSLKLTFSIVGYKTKEVIVANKTQTVNYELIEFPTELPTVIVKQAPIYTQGDTTNYNVGQFKGKEDRTIGDVIAKMPGITIDPQTGAISFNGKQISHYYINGLDLLGGKYNMANQNISADMVDQVQMLAHDKDIKLFDSLKTSQDPALNIKLKNKALNKFMGKGKVGLGITPLLYDNEIVGLLFSNKKQFIAAYKNNNAGTLLSNELSDNVSIQKVGTPIDKGQKEDILSVIGNTNPPINSKRYLFNNSHLVYVNGLNVFKNGNQIKTNISYLNDNTTYNNETNTTYFLPTGNVNFIEKVNGFINSNKYSGTIFYTANKKNRYLQNKSDLGLDFINSNNTIQNNSIINQNFKDPFYKFKNDFILFVPIKKTIVGINSKININKMPQQLNIAPGQFENIINQSTPYDMVSQNAIITNFNIDNNFSFSKTKGKLLHQTKLGFEYVFKNLASKTSKFYNQNIYNLNDSFKNNINWYNSRLYAEHTITFEKGEKTFELTLPLELNLINTTNSLSTVKKNYSNIFFNPSIDFNTPVFKNTSIGATYSYQNKINNNIAQIANGFILKNYRTLANNENVLPIEKLHTANVSLNYKNSVKSIFANLSISASSTEKNIIFSQDFNGAFITSKAINKENKQQNFLVSASVGKYFMEQKLNISFTVSKNYFSSDLLQQNNLVNNISNSLETEIKINYSKLSWLTLNADTKFAVTNNQIKGINSSKNSFVNFTQFLRTYFFLTKNSSLFFNSEFYSIGKKNGNTQNYIFGDIGFTQKFKKNDIEMIWSNITNNKSFTSISNNQNFQLINFYNIRPSNILIKFNFKF